MTKEEETTMTNEEAYRQDLRGGVWILFLLAIFTIGEFVVALVSPTIGWVLIIAALP
jgi:hypothetical protein